MEDFAIDIITGKGQMAASYHLPLPRFTLVGATTRAGQLTAPLRDRFGVTLKNYQLSLQGQPVFLMWILTMTVH